MFLMAFHFYSHFTKCMYNNGDTGDDFRRYRDEYFSFNSYHFILLCIRQNISST